MSATETPSPSAALVPALLRLAAPVAAARLGFMALGITDTIVVGQMAPHELGFLALGWAPTGVMLVTGLGLLTGVQVLGARAVGAGTPQEAGAVWRRGMAFGGAIGIVFAAFLFLFSDRLLHASGIAPELASASARVTQVLAISLPFQFAQLASSSFLEAIKRPAASAIVVWAANGLNLALNLWLVPRFGAVGAAYATIGGRFFMAAVLAAWILFSVHGRAHGAREPARGMGGYRALLDVGVASGVSQLAEAGAFSLMTVLAARISADAVAAYQVLLNILAVVFMIALGFSAAGAVLVSEAIGRGDHARAARAGWMALWLNTISMGVCAIVILIGASAIAHAFTSDERLAALIAGLAPLCALIIFPDGGQTVMAQTLRGRGDNWFPSASHILAYICVMPPLAYYLGEVLKRGVAGLMEAITIASLLSVAVLMARFAFLARQTPSTQPSSRSTI